MLKREGALTRPDDKVWVHEVPIARLHLLDALAAGQSLGQAAAHASSQASSRHAFDLQAALSALLDNGAPLMPPPEGLRPLHQLLPFPRVLPQ